MNKIKTPFSNERLPRTIIWSLILIGIIIYIPFSLLGVRTQISAFDLILPMIFIWAICTGRLTPPSRRNLIVAATVLSTLVAHSLGIYITKMEIELVWLLKETLKSTVLVVEFIMLLALASSQLLPLPTFRLCGTILVAGIIIVSVLTFLSVGGIEPFNWARTVYNLSLASFLFLLAADELWRESRRRQLLIAGAGLLVMMTAVLSLSKGAAGIVFAMSTWIILGGAQSRDSIRRGAAVFCGLLLVVIAGIGATEYAGTNFDMIRRMDTIERSVSIRLDLWSLAFTAFMDHFPFGLGLGQFWEVVSTDTNLAREGHRYVHNSFLTLIAELGLLGLGFAVGLLSLLVAAMRGWPRMLWPLFGLLIFVPLMIHDAHSIRMLMLITALGLAKFFTNNDKIARCDGP